MLTGTAVAKRYVSFDGYMREIIKRQQEELKELHSGQQIYDFLVGVWQDLNIPNNYTLNVDKSGGSLIIHVNKYDSLIQIRDDVLRLVRIGLKQLDWSTSDGAANDPLSPHSYGTEFTFTWRLPSSMNFKRCTITLVCNEGCLEFEIRDVPKTLNYTYTVQKLFPR